MDVALHPRVTLAAELIGRTLFDANRAVRTEQQFDFVDNVGTPRLGALPVVQFRKDDLSFYLASLGPEVQPRPATC